MQPFFIYWYSLLHSHDLDWKPANLKGHVDTCKSNIYYAFTSSKFFCFSLDLQNHPKSFLASASNSKEAQAVLGRKLFPAATPCKGQSVSRAFFPKLVVGCVRVVSLPIAERNLALAVTLKHYTNLALSLLP